MVVQRIDRGKRDLALTAGLDCRLGRDRTKTRQMARVLPHFSPQASRVRMGETLPAIKSAQTQPNVAAGLVPATRAGATDLSGALSG